MYHVKTTFATAARILQQLSHDPRTIALIFLVPCLLLALLRWMFTDTIDTFNHFAPALLGVFPFIIMFIITSITTLRERVTGTMERLMTTPLGKFDFIIGYMIAFGVLAIIQALLASTLLLYVFNLEIMGPDWFLIVVALADALLGTALGLFVSAFAKSEFQAVQFMPAFVLPQLLIGGLFVPLANMPDLLETIAYFLPLTYVIDALTAVVKNADITGDMWRDLWIVIGFMAGAILAGGLTLKRKTK
ncbi:MAG TPA: ABC transporter permease [Candidatus Saccharimonadales bacterium]|nr:ABC transporter permease [Candidatus Saccharimonadales bacterium]